jgi:hypothetical protein
MELPYADGGCALPFSNVERRKTES